MITKKPYSLLVAERVTRELSRHDAETLGRLVSAMAAAAASPYGPGSHRMSNGRSHCDRVFFGQNVQIDIHVNDKSRTVRVNTTLAGRRSGST